MVSTGSPPGCRGSINVVQPVLDVFHVWGMCETSVKYGGVAAAAEHLSGVMQSPDG